jgi:hypothetical protein
MSQEQFDRERRYCAAMAIVRELLNAGIIATRDYRHYETILARKYSPSLAGLLALT